MVVGSDRYTLELDSTTNPNLKLGIGGGGQMTSFNNGRLVADVGTASIVDVGGEGAASGIPSGSGLNWGRWQGPGSTIAQTLGNQVVHNDGGNLHYVYGNIATSMPTSGQVSYAPIGATRPTDSGTGAVGTLISGGSINVNFTTAQLALTGLRGRVRQRDLHHGWVDQYPQRPGFRPRRWAPASAAPAAAASRSSPDNFAGFLAGLRRWRASASTTISIPGPEASSKAWPPTANARAPEGAEGAARWLV